MIPTLLLDMLGGFVAHRSNDVFDALPGVFTGGWREITGHIVGVLGTYPFLELLYHSFDVPRELLPKLRAAFLMAFTFFGVGVALGWLFDTAQHHKRL